eukprot:NODE_201_length_13147_cov_1.076104.p11 type:complete len:105 gc:universal NODE_201_length_13147_cov_1.076104:7090-7404(+)
MELVSISTRRERRVSIPTSWSGKVFCLSKVGSPGGQTTPIYPSLNGKFLLPKIFAAICGSTLSSFVITPRVRLPSGSTRFAILKESEFARSTSAADTASIIFGN